MIQVSVGNGTVSVEYDGQYWDTETGLGAWRRQYRYVITANGWQYVGNDIRSGVGAEIDEPGMLGTLLGFMGACAESRQYPDGEHSDLFPDHVGQWCVDYSDDIGMVGWEYDPDRTDDDG